VNNWRLISWRIRPSTPANVDSKDCWLPLVLKMASMLAAVGGAAKAVEAKAVMVKDSRIGLKKLVILSFLKF
jgi:hypothetical protein